MTKLKKKSSQEPLDQFQPNLPRTVHPWVKGIQVCSKEEPFNSHKVNNEEFFSLYQHMIIMYMYVFIDFQEVSSGERCGPWASCLKMKSDSCDTPGNL